MKRLLLSLCATVALCASAYASPHSYIEADSITDNMQDFNYLTSYTEANYAAFPAIISNGFGSQYNAMKTSLKEAVLLSTGNCKIINLSEENILWGFKI